MHRPQLEYALPVVSDGGLLGARSTTHSHTRACCAFARRSGIRDYLFIEYPVHNRRRIAPLERLRAQPRCTRVDIYIHIYMRSDTGGVPVHRVNVVAYSLRFCEAPLKQCPSKHKAYIFPCLGGEVEAHDGYDAIGVVLPTVGVALRRGDKRKSIITSMNRATLHVHRRVHQLLFHFDGTVFRGKSCRVRSSSAVLK